ncbi:MAG: peptide chain release factor 1 [Chloroflexota bacterium]|nr:peptide chain release factor 1 [Chloroflexota bacterium]
MLDRLEALEKRYQELTLLMAQPKVSTDFERLQTLAKERAALEGTVAKYRELRKTERELEEARSLLGDGADEDMAALARQEVEALKARRDRLLQAIKEALLPRDPADEKDVILEIRGGTGGDEAALFAADLFRMYARYAQSRGWGVEVINTSESGVGGFKEITFEIKGKGAYSRLKHESGVHRVQRVPVTEASGRIHTSTATVAVLPQVDEVEVQVNPDDLRVDIFHSGGAGGQNVNKVATAVRLVHLPTGMIVTCQDERSQLKNRVKAMAVLRARLYDQERRKQQEEISETRRSQVGSAERAEKVRTYNFPQDRLTDHRVGLTVHNLPRILAGNLDEILDALATGQQARELEGKPA